MQVKTQAFPPPPPTLSSSLSVALPLLRPPLSLSSDCYLAWRVDAPPSSWEKSLFPQLFLEKCQSPSSCSFFLFTLCCIPASPSVGPHSQLLWGFSSHQQRTSQDSERAVAKPAAAQLDSPRMGGGTRLFPCCWVGGHHPSPRLSSNGSERASRPLPYFAQPSAALGM